MITLDFRGNCLKIIGKNSGFRGESFLWSHSTRPVLGCTVNDLIRDPALRARINVANYVTERIGLPTLKDILDELTKPGRDPRQQFEAFKFAEGVAKPSDLKPGMKLPGIVTNVPH